MTHPEILQAYKEKYKAFPDLVERIHKGFYFTFWAYANTVVRIEHFANWHQTEEGFEFWDRLYEHEESGTLTRESIDAAYKEFGIEPLTPEIDMMKFVEESYYCPLFSHLSQVHGLTLIDSEMDDIIKIVKGM
ncbi:hypothetical protein [Pedobacter sp.]|uniref:hypothetical protein n=1 Tax=Pedobacter sp. TaxID=1411316 RepID=UPI003C6A1064